MASDKRGYWSRSWALLTRDEGWFKPLLVLAAARFVPIVGAFGADGYALEWARLTSWGVDSSPKQKNVDVAACIKTGAKAFVVALGYYLAMMLLRVILVPLLGEVLGSIFALALSVFTSTLVLVAQVRATIYQTIGAGYQVERIIDMIKRDYKGLLRIVGLTLAVSAVLGLLVILIVALVFAINVGAAMSDVSGMSLYYYSDEQVALRFVISALSNSLPIICILMYLFSILHTATNLILSTSVGLWMRQFDVTNWGDSSDPLPTTSPADTSSPARDARPEATVDSAPGMTFTTVTTYAAAAAAAAESSDAQQTSGTRPAAQQNATGAAESYDYGSKASSWDAVSGNQEGRWSEASNASDSVMDIPVVPLESFNAAKQAAAAEPIPEPEETEPSGDAFPYEAPTDKLAADALADEEPVADDANDQPDAEEVQLFSLYDEPVPEDAPAEEAADVTADEEAVPAPVEDTDAMPEEPSAEDDDEELTIDELLERTEEAIRAADVVREEEPIAQNIQGEVAIFDFDDFVAAEPSEEPVADEPQYEVPAQDVSPEAEPADDEAAEDLVPEEDFVPTASDEGEIVEVISLSGTPDQDESPEADTDDLADTKQDE